MLEVKTNAASADVVSMTASVDGRSISLSEADGAQYLFLPASADLTKLPLRFELSENKGALVLSGDKSRLTLDAAEQTIDLTALASSSNGSYTVTARIGGGDALTVHVMQGTGLPTLYLTSSTEDQNRDWVDVTATVRKEYIEAYQGEGPVLYVDKITTCANPAQEVVSF